MRVNNRNISLPDLQELCSSLNYTPSKGQLVSRVFNGCLILLQNHTNILNTAGALLMSR